jgi:hypothetical protein
MYIICIKGGAKGGSMSKNAFILGEREAYLGFYVG